MSFLSEAIYTYILKIIYNMSQTNKNTIYKCFYYKCFIVNVSTVDQDGVRRIGHNGDILSEFVMLNKFEQLFGE